MVEKPVIQVLASAIQARLNCIKSGNGEWQNRHEATIADIEANWLPHGSGFDIGCTVDIERSSATKVVFCAAYHHMDEHGYYDGWSHHTVTVTPTFDGIDVKISGRDRNGFKDYAHEVFCSALLQPYKPD